MSKNILNTKVLVDNEQNINEPTFVKINSSISGIISFETTTNEKEKATIKELKECFK